METYTEEDLVKIRKEIHKAADAASWRCTKQVCRLSETGDSLRDPTIIYYAACAEGLAVAESHVVKMLARGGVDR